MLRVVANESYFPVIMEKGELVATVTGTRKELREVWSSGVLKKDLRIASRPPSHFSVLIMLVIQIIIIFGFSLYPDAGGLQPSFCLCS